GKPSGTDQPCYGSRVDNGSAALTEHLGNFISHAEPDACQVDRDDLMPHGLGTLCRQRASSSSNPRIVMGTIQPSIRGHSLRDQGLHFNGLGDVGPDKDSLPTLFGDHMARLVSTRLVHVGYNQFGTFSGKGERSGSS